MDQTKQDIVLKVAGMTCHSCEQRVEAAAGKVTDVESAKANQAHGTLTVTLKADTVNRGKTLAEVEAAVKKAGYLVKGHAKTASAPSLATVLVIAAGMIAAFLLINSQGWFNFLPTIDSSVGLGMIFVAGLLTSVHCIAMCGGIAISQQTRVPVDSLEFGTETPAADASDPKSRLRASLRGLQYHAGRIVSYTILGGIVGAIGSVISFSPVTKGILAGVAGLFMVLLGLRMLGLLPHLPRLKFKGLQRFFSPKLIDSLRSRGPFFVGLLNGLMPCGPLQTMQLYALGTGSAALGALSMFLFSLGTVPLMFLFGAVSGFFSVKWQHRLVRASAMLVVFFGLVMAGRALDLSGASGMVETVVSSLTSANASAQAVGGSISAPASAGTGVGGSSAASGTTVANVKDGVQYVSFDLQPGSYAPITVQKGIPVKWTINATEDNLNGCNGEITVPQLGLKKKMAVGANLIEFTPQSSGIISYTCWMGMISSKITVVDDLGSAANAGTIAIPQDLQAQNPAGVSGGCCGSGNATAFAGGVIPTDQIQLATFTTEGGKQIQEVTVNVNDKGYSPAVFVVQKGVPARIKFVASQLNSCNQYVDFPDYGGGLDLGSAQKDTPLLPVSKDFVFQCGMSMLHGYVKVVDDLGKVDQAAVRATVKAWKPAAGSGGMSCCAPQTASK